MKIWLFVGLMAFGGSSFTGWAGLDRGVVEPPEVMRAYAEAGDPMAQNNLGVSLKKGEGVPKDAAQGVSWFRKAAAAGYPEAQHNLGVALAQGEGAPKDLKESAKWFEKAAHQGLFESQRALIDIYAGGLGVEKSLAKALEWDFVARRSLQLRHGKDAGKPLGPASLRPDGFAEYETAMGIREAIGPDGSVERVNNTGGRVIEHPNGTKTFLRPDGSREMHLTDGRIVVEFPDGRREAKGSWRPATQATDIRMAPNGPAQTFSVRPIQTFRPGSYSEANIYRELDELQEAARKLRFYAGLSAADYQRAAAVAQSFKISLPVSPQKAAAGGWMNSHLASDSVVPPAPALKEIPNDRADRHPLGLQGRTVIKLYPWKHAETERFIVHYLQNSDAYPVMRFIDCAYAVVTRTLQLDVAKVPRKMHVFIFPDAAAWRSFTSAQGMPSSVAGFAYKDELLLGAHEDKDTYARVLCHEATHAVVAHFYPGRKWPLWLSEGFAEYMAARAMALRRGHRVDKYLTARRESNVNVENVFDRADYGVTPGVVGEVVNFYADSEKCVRVLLQKLPAPAFPKFANLAFAGNSIPICLQEAYGAACPDAARFETLVNAGP